MARLTAGQIPLSLDGRSYWTILDSTDAITVVKYLREMEVEHISLYKGEAEEHFWDLAPYLARLDQPLLDWMLEHYWEQPWGIVMQSDADLQTLRAHFRKFLRVKDMKGRNLYFRFYDPRVMAAFLPRCLPNELPEFFGPVKTFWTPIPRSYDYKSFQLEAESERTPAAAAPAGGERGR